MDSVKFLLYVLKRIGIFIAVDLFGSAVAKVFVPAIASFFPATGAAKRFLTEGTGGSLVGWAVMLILLSVVFFDDGKKHTAYEIWNSINIIIALIFMFLVYFIPSVFRDSFHQESKGDVFYSIIYAPVQWLEDKFDMAYTSSAGIGIGIILFVLFVVYVVSYKIYLRKHKSLA